MTVCRLIATTGVAALFLPAQAMAGQARLTISSGKTKNVQCSAGVCAPTATSAVLNVRDLETMLASGNVEVTTTGAGVQANNIQFDAPFSWLGTNTLWLDAFESIAIAKPITVKGTGGLKLTTNDGGSGGTFAFSKKGHVIFKKLASSLAINGTSYVLVGDIATLASDVAAEPGGAYALAGNYDASGDGTYSAAPIATTFTGTFEGLGNEISNLTIDDSTEAQGVTEYVGLFSQVDEGGTLRDVHLTNANISAGNSVDDESWGVGALAGVAGIVENCSATGTVTSSSGESQWVGGLLGYGSTIMNSHANSKVGATETDTAGGGVYVGGLAGTADDVDNSYAAGAVTGSAAEGSVYAGGLFGFTANSKSIINSYATGNVSATTNNDDFSIAESGGLIGDNEDGISNSYASGTVSASGGTCCSGVPSSAGGLIGWQASSGSISDDYWDTTTSGTNTGVGYGSSSGVTGLTTEQFQSGLPAGFDPSIWREKSKINGGFPYLIANPPAR
jgi:hypothetical protein